MKKLVYSAATLLAATAMAPAANAAFLLTLNADTIALNTVDNIFTTELGLLGLSHVGVGALTLSAPANITFEFIAQESGYANTFETTFGSADLSYTENFNHSQVQNHFAGGAQGAPILIGTKTFSGAGNLSFKFTNGVTGDSPVGSPGLGVMLGAAGLSGDPLNLGNVIYLAYDDQNQTLGDDDNHDDMIIRATLSPVPEPATWAFMLLGFGAVGYSLRRRPTSKMAQAV